MWPRPEMASVSRIPEKIDQHSIKMSQRGALRSRVSSLVCLDTPAARLEARLEIVRERRTGQWTHASNTSHDRGPTERDPHTCATSTTQLASERHTHARDDRPDVVRDKVRTPVHRRPPLKVSPGRPIHGVIHRDFRRVCAFDAWPTPHGAWCVRARSVEMSEMSMSGAHSMSDDHSPVT